MTEDHLCARGCAQARVDLISEDIAMDLLLGDTCC